MNFSTTVAYNTTPGPSGGQTPVAYGFLGIAVAAIGFGTNYLPIKKFETGDGMFFQWILASAIFIGGFIINAILNFPKFEPLVLIGGFLWATGNICVVPIIRLIGLGVGLLLWSSTNLIIGWASARFGWFGIIPQLPNNFTLNYIGFALTAISPFIYSMVKTNISEEIIANIDEGLDDDDTSKKYEKINEVKQFSINENTESQKNMRNKIIAIVLSIFSGTLYGLMFIPCTYVKNHQENASQKDIDYMFAQSTGIYLTSTVYFVIYCIYKRNKPTLYPQCILPGLLSGTIWFCAYIGFFIANETLSPAISQPIISALPGLISVIITTIVYHEIKGIKNYAMIAVAFVITSIGVALTALSKMLNSA